MAKYLFSGVSALSVALALAAAAPANAALLTFAGFNPNGAAQNFSWTNNGSGGSISGSGATYFNYINIGGNSTFNANLTFSGVTPSGNDAYYDGGNYYQTVNGAFSFIYSGATTTVGGITYTHGVTNILSGTFTGGVLEGNTTGIVFSTPDVPTLVNFTSDVLGFNNVNMEGFSLSLSQVTPVITSTDPDYYADPTDPSSFTTGSTSLSSFTALANGTFVSNPLPTIPTQPNTPPVSVPEPASWAMMLVGFGFVGAFARRRSVALTA